MQNRALIFVHDTKNLASLAKYLAGEGWEISAAGTAGDFLKRNGIAFTHEECMGEKRPSVNIYHRLVQSVLTPGRQFSEEPEESVVKLVCVNIPPRFHDLRDFQDVSRTENCIDIRYVALIRAAAKNHMNVLALTDPADYKEAIIQMKTGAVSEGFRLYLAGKALNLTAANDASAAYSILSRSCEHYFPTYYLPVYEKQPIIHQGLNEHQAANFYSLNIHPDGFKSFQKIQGAELDFASIKNAFTAWKTVSTFIKIIKNPFTVESTDANNYTFTTQFTPAAGSVFTVGVKNASPIGAALGPSVFESYKKTFSCEPADFDGAVLGCSAVIDGITAEELSKAHLAAVVAPDFTKDALKILAERKELRLISANRFISDFFECVSIDDGLLVQTPDSELFRKWHIVTQTRPVQSQIDAMAFGILIAMMARSDCSIVVVDSAAVGIASGHTNRSKAVRLALEDADEYSARAQEILDANSKILVSDSAIPFDERTAQIAEHGIKAIIQAGGAQNDEEFIDFCNQKGISMIFTGMPHISF